MKKLIFLFCLWLVACDSKNAQENSYQVSNYDSLLSHTQKRISEKKQEKLQREIERKCQDSIKLVLDSLEKVDFDRKIVDLFASHTSKRRVDLEQDSIKIEVKFGNFFNKRKKYAILKILTPPYYTQVWVEENKMWKKLNQVDYPLGGYYLKDVNFDGVTDFLYELYGNLDDPGNLVYLYDRQLDNFVEVEMDLNPYYDPYKKTVTTYYIREGTGSGHKYIWEGFKLKEVE